MKNVRFFGLSILLGGCSLLVSACVVDKSKYEFDDDKYDMLSSGGRKGGGGTSSGGEGGDTSSGGEGGDPASGGTAQAGGQGGETASGGASQSCLTGDLECNGKQLEICTGTTRIAVGEPCPFVCAGDQCTGVCEPTAHECVSEKDQRVCNDEGQWELETCEFACVGGGCDGVCEPGDRQCGDPDAGLIPIEVCNAGGAWKGTATICENCEDGICVGDCDENDTQCGTTESGDPSVLTCPAGDGGWEEAIETPCVDQACVEGACVGECRPSNTTCSGRTFRTCSTAGAWTDVVCPFVCSSTMGCLGVCQPGTEKCDGDVVLQCNALGAWEKSEVCEGDTPLCVHLSETNKACGQCNPPQKGEEVLFCHMTSVVQCSERGLLEEVEHCGKDGSLCYKGECFDSKVCPASGVDGCFDAGTGWTCATRGKPSDGCRCNCSSGVSCARGCAL